MKKSIIATVILGLVSGGVLASNAHNYQPGATNNTERLADIDPNYELTMPSEKEGYTNRDNQFLSEGGTYTTYEKPNPNDSVHIADKGSMKLTHAQGGGIMTEYTTKNGANTFTVMCGYTSGPSFWADSKPANVCKEVQELAVALKAKGQWKMNPMIHTIPEPKITAESSL